MRTFLGNLITSLLVAFGMGALIKFFPAVAFGIFLFISCLGGIVGLYTAWKKRQDEPALQENLQTAAMFLSCAVAMIFYWMI